MNNSEKAIFGGLAALLVVSIILNSTTEPGPWTFYPGRRYKITLNNISATQDETQIRQAFVQQPFQIIAISYNRTLNGWDITLDYVGSKNIDLRIIGPYKIIAQQGNII